MSRDALLERYGWWASLNHGGMLMAPSKLAGRFAETIEPLPEWRASRLRRDVLRAREGNADAVSGFLDILFEDIVGLHQARWVKGSDVAKEYTRTSNAGEVLRPARMWFGDNGARLAVFYPEQASGGLRAGAGYRLGVGRGRRAVVRVVEWLRKSGEKIALLATGRQVRLVHAGTDYEAFCEWDTDLWFQEGAPGLQVDALRLLLSPEALTPAKQGTPSPLLSAIADSRKGQAELSGALGERVRQAVELLIQVSGAQLLPLVHDRQNGVTEREIYLAATRLVMRCVVVLFAEARELLPRTNPVYEQSYGLQALRVELERQSGGRSADRLRHSFGAWPRLVGLFALMFHGSEHEAMLLTRYGGGLFEPGSASSDDPVKRAIAAFERAEVSDADVQRILELITRCPTRVRQGKGATTVQTPVDFSDLGSEYIGILYEGLLDYELKRAGDTEAVIFLGIGSEPALPFDVLNGMSNADLAELLKKLGKATKAADDSEEEENDAPEEGVDAGDEPDSGADDDATDEASEAQSEDGRRAIREAVQDWAERAVKAAKLEKYPRNDHDARVRDAYARNVTVRAKSLVRRLVLPGEWYLVRWGGTRKGAGTFYTRPQLAGPIVRRTLAPLCFEDAVDGLDPKPRKPEDILALKVCDPAMGSGSFLVSALRYLTDALLQSLYVHGRLDEHGDRWYIRLADGLPLNDPSQESLPVPKDEENFDDLLRARLKRHVVERCLYGVDLDPLAVELARTALWVETMDYQLPFGFLDHKLKCGNSLVGAWLDRFEDYPIRAWDREGGDAKHTNFVRHFREEKGRRKGDIWNSGIRVHREAVILPALRSSLQQLAAETAGQQMVAFETHGRSAPDLHAEALKVFEELHGIIPIFEAERRAEVYEARILLNPALKALRRALDTWCAVWFWPGDKLDLCPTPEDLLTPSAEARAQVERLARDMRFFHWEIEFPDVMTGTTSGFSAVVGNPPWETLQPVSMEFFANIDPLYRTYGKQEAIKKQSEYFREREAVEDEWIRYNARFNALANWTREAAFPFGVEEGGGALLPGVDRVLAEVWQRRRVRRLSFSDRGHPYRHQGGGKPYTYKLFLESALALLRQGGRLGFLIPSGIYSDNGSEAMRARLLDHCAWTHLYVFQNERFIFDGIHHSYKMAAVQVSKGGRTAALRTRFRIGPGDSPEATELEEDLSDDGRYLTLPAERIARFSPTTRSILEIRTPRDLRVLEKLYASGVSLAGMAPLGAGVSFRQGDFNMTSDSAMFSPRTQWEAGGYKPDEYGHWLKGHWHRGDGVGDNGLRDWRVVRSASGDEVIAPGAIEGVALPVHQGIMVRAFDVAAKEWASGTGLKAVWRAFEPGSERLAPQYLIGAETISPSTATSRWKVAYRRIARTTDARTWIGAMFAPAMLSGDSIFYLSPAEASASMCAGLAAIANSFVYDWQIRDRLGGTNISWFVLQETAIPRLDTTSSQLLTLVLRLNCHLPLFAGVWGPQKLSWRRLWASTPFERLRLRAMLDALVAQLFGLDEDELGWILRDCDRPAAEVCDSRAARELDPKGFWRVDKEKHPELRHPVLALVAFHELQKLGLEKFVALNDGDGWQLPETLRLADYGLGHDDRAKEHQPVSAALGERFLPWQLNEDVEASWEECRRHAELIERILASGQASAPARATPQGPAQQSLLGTEPLLSLTMPKAKGKKR